MKAACLLTDSTYILAVSNNGGKGKDVFGSRFTKTGEGAEGDRIAGAGSARRGSVSKIVVGTEARVSGTIVGTEARTEAGIGTSSIPAYFPLLLSWFDLPLLNTSEGPPFDL